MQVAFLACLAVVLVLAPAAHAQESQPGMLDLHTGICWDDQCVNYQCLQGRNAADGCNGSGCPTQDNLCEACNAGYLVIHGECIETVIECNEPCTECEDRTDPDRTICTDCIEGYNVVEEACVEIIVTVVTEAPAVQAAPTEAPLEETTVEETPLEVEEQVVEEIATTPPTIPPPPLPCVPHCIEDEDRDGGCYCLNCEEGWLAIEGVCSGDCGIKHCINCGESQTSCEKECEEGWVLTNDGQCTMNCLVENCIQCLPDRPNFCDVCAETYGRDHSGQCILIDTNCWDTNCITCSNDPPDECIADQTQGVTNNGRYCDSCLVGFSMVRCECLDTENECGENCLDCQPTDDDENPFECYQCTGGFILEDSKCVVDAVVALSQCDVSMCSKCVEGDPNKCAVCESEILIVNDEGKCVINQTIDIQ